MEKEYDFDPFHKKTSLSSLIGISMHDKLLPSLPLTEPVSTLTYQSPEMLKGSYDFKSDIWAIGVTLYYMLCGDLPFIGNDQKSIKFCICFHQ
jgi:serine/threonine protein kinase